MQNAAPRYAIYYTPEPSSPLAQFGAGVIGYDPAAKTDVPHLRIDGIAPSELAAATEAPRKYGFHATLVAPFYLSNEAERDLLKALDDFCNRVEPVRLGSLQVARLGDFLALTPKAHNRSLNELAAHCVAFFNGFRAPLSAEDLARRSNGRLSPRQRANLERWGYPYVFEDFRFHMTLTGLLAAGESERLLPALTKAYQPLADHGLAVDALSLVRQSAPNSRFEVIARRLLRGTRGAA